MGLEVAVGVPKYLASRAGTEMMHSLKISLQILVYDERGSRSNQDDDDHVALI
jgi:hypothetical protein